MDTPPPDKGAANRGGGGGANGAAGGGPQHAHSVPAKSRGGKNMKRVSSVSARGAHGRVAGGLRMRQAPRRGGAGAIAACSARARAPARARTGP